MRNNTFNNFCKSIHHIGSQLQPQMKEKCAANYLAGLEASLNDEQKTVDFYHQISDDATDQAIMSVFRRAAFHEQNHAVWFLFL